MGNVFTLDSLREELDKEFAPVKIVLSDGTEVTLRPLLRLGKKERESVLKALEDLDKRSEDTDVDEVARLVDTAEGVVKTVADKGAALLKELDGDLHLLLKVLSTWMEQSQAGEAPSSPVS